MRKWGTFSARCDVRPTEYKREQRISNSCRTSKFFKISRNSRKSFFTTLISLNDYWELGAIDTNGTVCDDFRFVIAIFKVFIFCKEKFSWFIAQNSFKRISELSLFYGQILMLHSSCEWRRLTSHVPRIVWKIDLAWLVILFCRTSFAEMRQFKYYCGKMRASVGNASGRRAVRLLEDIYFDQWNNYVAFCRSLVYWTRQNGTARTNMRDWYMVVANIMKSRDAFKRFLEAS